MKTIFSAGHIQIQAGIWQNHLASRGGVSHHIKLRSNSHERIDHVRHRQTEYLYPYHRKDGH